MIASNPRRLLPMAAFVAAAGLLALGTTRSEADRLITIGGTPPPNSPAGNAVPAMTATEPTEAELTLAPTEPTVPAAPEDPEPDDAVTGATSPSTSAPPDGHPVGSHIDGGGEGSDSPSRGGGGGDGNGEGGPVAPSEPAPPPRTERPPPPPPPPRQLDFGVSTQPSILQSRFLTFTAEDTARAARDLAPGSIVRVTVPWAWAQPGRSALGGLCANHDPVLLCPAPGEMGFAFLDADLRPLLEQGLRVLLVPIGAPAWARSPSDTPLPNSEGDLIMPPANDEPRLTQWRDFVAALVGYVAGRFPGILAGVEVWNEPEGREFWTTVQGADPERYVNLLCRAYDGVKAVDPDIPVVFAGTNPMPPPPLTGAGIVRDFVARAYGAGAASCMDALGVHAYPRVAHAGHRSQLVQEQVEGFVTLMETMRSIAAANSDSGRRLWITEVNLGRTDANDQEMADYLAAAYASASAMPDVDLFTVYTLFDFGAPDRFERTAGICGGPNRPQPAADLLKQLVSGSTEPATC